MTILEQMGHPQHFAVLSPELCVYSRDDLRDWTIGRLENDWLDNGDAPALMASRMAVAQVLSTEPVSVEARTQAVSRYLPSYTTRIDHMLMNEGNDYRDITRHAQKEVKDIATAALLLGDRETLVVPKNTTIDVIVWGHTHQITENLELPVACVSPRAVSMASAMHRILRRMA